MQDLPAPFPEYDSIITATFRNNGPGVAEAVVITFDYFTAIENPWKVLTPTDTIGDLMDCEDRPSQRQFYCELDATATLVMNVTRTGNISIPTVVVSATTPDPDLSNNEWEDWYPEGGVEWNTTLCYILAEFYQIAPEDCCGLSGFTGEKQLSFKEIKTGVSR